MAEAVRAKKELHRAQLSGHELGFTAEPSAPILHEPTTSVIRPKKKKGPRVQMDNRAFETTAPVPYQPPAFEMKPTNKESPRVQVENLAFETTAPVPCQALAFEMEPVNKENRRIQIDNLAFETTEDDIRKLLHGYSPYVHKHFWALSHPYSHVTFSSSKFKTPTNH